ncbi:hypothetical protein M404DRAFT_971045 [Pisolithus tinctorius Marx 270]|uniref:DDE-1 domain-containing protein n=1 Tax=Pisolithus tinctorius Marx 270 TaxID=870435 RepID=A0A0C3PP58_PISTI|nr:hypothetical protein M404DRAFT_971045 [Pisolithus tinctorius Marx 270]
MTTTIYQDWLSDWDKKLRREERNILLLQDNFAGHVAPTTLTNIDVENFEANLTAHVQPNDQGIIRCFKAHYRAKFIHRSIDLYETGTTPTHVYDIDQLEGMRLAEKAWSEVDTTTIRNCWKKAGILPPNMDAVPIHPTLPISSLIHATRSEPETPNDPIQQAENAVESALNDLEKTGILQHTN